MAKIRKLCLFLFLSCGLSMSLYAQMSDEQVINYVKESKAAGKGEQEIGRELVSRGVNKAQVERIKARYEESLGSDTEVANPSAGNERRERRSVENSFTETTAGSMDVVGEVVGDPTEQSDRRASRLVFGRDVFNGRALTFEPNENMATPKNYCLGPGDEVIIDIWGTNEATIRQEISPEGNIMVSQIGPVYLNGLTITEAGDKIRKVLARKYAGVSGEHPESEVRVTLGQIRSIQINVMGEVMVPGTYRLSSFSTVFHALYRAGGISNIGSLRNIRVMRGGRQMAVVDVYDYILKGKLDDDVRLEEGDVIIVPPYDMLVDIQGNVKRPMYYEMKQGETLTTLIQYAGGFAGDAYTEEVRVIRRTGRENQLFSVQEKDYTGWKLEDGDAVTVGAILDRFANRVEIRGSVFRPGMYQVGGSINSVRSLIEHADGLREEAFTARAVMHRMKADRTLEVIPVDVDGILAGRVADIPIQNNDVLFIPTKQELMEQQTITIHGEVFKPGVYKYADNETLEDIVLQAGGLKQTASTVKVDVARRMVNPKALTTDSIIARTYTFALKDGFVIDGEPGFKLMPFDEVYVRKSPGFYKQQNVIVEGEVMFGGTYTLSKKNQRLSDLIKNAGGVNDRAYVEGARLERRLNDTERKRLEVAKQMALEQAENLELEAAAQSRSLDLSNAERLKKFEIPETYSVGIELDKALANPGGDEDIVLREGDRLVVPQYNATVKINGEVMYPNTVGFIEGKKAKYYISQAGGYSNRAKKSQAFIIYMNGTVAKVSDGAKPKPGCEIFVPQKKISTMTIADKMTIGTSVASIATVIASLANILK